MEVFFCSFLAARPPCRRPRDSAESDSPSQSSLALRVPDLRSIAFPDEVLRPDVFRRRPVREAEIMCVLYLCGAQLRTSYSFFKIPPLCLGAALKIECTISAGLPQKNASPPVSNP